MDHSDEPESESSKLNPEGIFDNKDLKQNDPEILKYIRDHHLTPPSTEPYEVGSGNPSLYVDELESLFENQTNGFFVECGTNGGLFMSNTIALERDKNWTGLLIEGIPGIELEIKPLNRKAWIADVCLSVKPYPHKVELMYWGGAEQVRYKGIDQGQDNWNGVGDATKFFSSGIVDCFPLLSLLSAINVNVTRVDYLNMNIQGVEFKILEAIPFDEIDIRVVSVLYEFTPGRDQALEDLMKTKGYRQVFKRQAAVFFLKNSDSGLQLCEDCGQRLK